MKISSGKPPADVVVKPDVRRGRKPRKDRSSDIADGLFETDRPGGLHERVYRSLIHAIASGKYEKGARLPSEPELATTFAVSRPVVRQALERLRTAGTIESLRGSGNYVANVDSIVGGKEFSRSYTLVQMQHMIDDLEFRLLIEPQAAFLAAVRRDGADMHRMESAMQKFGEAHAADTITHHFDFLFHEAIAMASSNMRFVDAVRSLEYRPDDERIMMRHVIHFRPQARGAEVLGEHGAVLDLIRKKDGEGAKQAMWAHIESARRRLISHLDTLDDAIATDDEVQAGARTSD